MMDKLTIKGEKTGLISWVLRQIIKKQIGYDVDIQQLNITASASGEKVQLHLDADAELNEEDFEKIVQETILAK
jgi:hypothetical protein